MRSKSILTLVTVGLLSTQIVSPAVANDDWHYVPSCEVDDSSSQKLSSTESNTTPTTAQGSWTTPGSAEYLVAKEIFDTYTQTYGTSGAFAAGVIANVKQESGFIPDRAEGAGTLRFGMNSTVAPAGHSGGGGGLYQFTPYSKYTNSEYWGKLKTEGWSPANQTAFVFEKYIRSRTLDTYMAFRATSLYGRSPAFATTEEALSTDDPRKAADAFQTGYEGPAVYHPEREDDAVIADQIFNKSKIKADPSKWNLGGSTGSNDVTAASTQKNIKPEDTSDDCQSNDEQEEELDWNDFTGEHGLDLGSYGDKSFKKNQLPSSLKKYLIDLEKIGVGFNNCSTWNSLTNTTDPFLNGQCVALSKVALHKIWQTNGNPSFSCNGGGCADAAAAAFGGTVSNKPSKGAIAQQTSLSQWGHTYIVSHVFSNGDILIIEQNIPGYSGANNGESCNWSYAVVAKHRYEAQNAKFFSPGTVGKKPHPLLKGKTAKPKPGDGKALAAAFKYDGTTYGAYERGSQTGLDCSGLVWQSYLDIGKPLGAMTRTAHQQWSRIKSEGRDKGRDISKWTRGDLLFWDYEGDGRVDHVAFYLGDGQIYDAQSLSTPNGQHELFDIPHIVGAGQF